MSYTTSLIKAAIKLTPTKLIRWVANFKLKGIVEITDVNFDLEARTAYIQLQLDGEAEAIEVWVKGFGIISRDENYYFTLTEGRSNRSWLHNLFARIGGKPWKIPAIPKFRAQMALVAELLKIEESVESTA